MTSTATTAPEQLVRDFFAAMGPTLPEFKRNYRERMTADVVWETVALTERLDTMHRADGTAIMTFRVMGAIELQDRKISRYTDYLDTWQARSELSSPPPHRSSPQP